MAEKDRIRKKEIRVKVSEDELKIAKDKAKYAGAKNTSDYIRKIIVDGKIVKLPVDEIIECTKAINETRQELNKIGNNINQLMKAIHENRDLYSKRQIQEAMNELDNVTREYDKLCEVMIMRLYGVE